MYFLFPKYLKVSGLYFQTCQTMMKCQNLYFGSGLFKHILQCFIKLIFKKIFQFLVEVCLQSMFAEDDNSLSEMMMALMIFCWGRYFLYYDVFHLHNKKNDDKNTLYFKTEIYFSYNKDCKNYFLHKSFKTFQLIVNWEWWFQNE